MQKILLTLTLAFIFIGANAQCTPDPQFTVVGIYPDTTIGLTPAYVGQSYNQVITIINPLDTNVVYNGIPIDVTVQTIELTSVTGLPQNFTYDCLAPNCVFAGGSTSCAVLFSTSNPTSADLGSYQIIMNTTTTVDAGIGVPITQDDVIDYYYLDIVNTTSTINQLDNTTFELKVAYPNPASNQSKIQFVSGIPENIMFKIYNLLGEEIESQLIPSLRGVNTININTSSYSEGIYLYSINNGKQLLTKRMVIAN